MKTKSYSRSSWVAFGLFYLVLILIITVLDLTNNVLRLPYWGTQVALISVGVGIFIAVGNLLPDLSAARGVLLAFTVGILTIIPAVLMGLGRIPGLWPQYFYVAFGMAAGSFLSFLFVRFSKKVTDGEQSDLEGDQVE